MIIVKPSHIDEKIIEKDAVSRYSVSLSLVRRMLDDNKVIVVKDSTTGVLLGYSLFSLGIINDIQRTTCRILAIYTVNEEAEHFMYKYFYKHADDLQIASIMFDTVGIDSCNKWADYFPALCCTSDNSSDFEYILSDTGKELFRLVDFYYSNLDMDARLESRVNIPELASTYNSILQYIEQPVQGVYKVNIFNTEFCKELTTFMDGVEFNTNEEEGRDYQLPEYVLGINHAELYSKAVGIFERYFARLAGILNYRFEYSIITAQLTRYSSDLGIDEGHWHFDKDSDLTVVGYLNDDYTGGGLSILEAGSMKQIDITSINTGDIVMFNGHTTIHKGLKVESGHRDLLVYWTKGV